MHLYPGHPMQVSPCQNTGDVETHGPCNMHHDTMRPETGSASRTSLSSHTSPFSPTANCWNQGASTTRKPRRGDKLTLHPFTAVTASASSIHADVLTTSPHCNKCGYSHPPNKCPTIGQQCFGCSGSNHFTALCRWKNRRQ